MGVLANKWISLEDGMDDEVWVMSWMGYIAGWRIDGLDSALVFVFL